MESLELCLKWFHGEIVTGQSNHSNYIIFNVTGDRDARKMMRMFGETGIDFERVIFVPNVARRNENSKRFCSFFLFFV